MEEQQQSTFSSTDANVTSKAPTPSNSSSVWGFSALSSFAQTLKSTSKAITSELSEFAGAFKSENKEIIDKIKETKDKSLSSKSFSSFGGSLWSSALRIIHSIEGEHSVHDLSQTPSDGNILVPSVRASKLRIIEMNEKTYLCDPYEADFEPFSRRFADEFEQTKNEFQALLSKNEVVRSFYQQHVPNVVPERLFWTRYAYRVHELDVEDEKRRHLLERMEKMKNEEPVSGWDDDDEPLTKDADDSQAQPSEEPLRDPTPPPDDAFDSAVHTPAHSHDFTDSIAAAEALFTSPDSHTTPAQLSVVDEEAVVALETEEALVASVSSLKRPSDSDSGSTMSVGWEKVDKADGNAVKRSPKAASSGTKSSPQEEDWDSWE